MKVIKRNGSEVTFDITKIISAVHKANREVQPGERLTTEQIQKIARNVEEICRASIRSMNVEEIQDAVEDEIMAADAFHVARAYITYRYKRQLVR
ncbi:MAG: anaerobic ribonucleoside-triphosphate reductase, partial [Clostridiales bacterium]|nr:anaerobic ribonucleoside-triphosphate reductase [Clostridiales bacterium]